MRLRFVLVVVVMLAAACGGDEDAATTTTEATTTTTEVATTTTEAATTTTAEPTTTTAAPTTTTTEPPPPFRFLTDGLGIVSFGDPPDVVMAALTELFGEPLSDSGWIDEVLCPGPLNRFVDFGVEAFDLQVLFTTGGLFAPAGTEHFYSYFYRGATPVPVSPPDLTVGTKLSELQALYPDVEVLENPFDWNEFVYRVKGEDWEETGWIRQLWGRLSGDTAGDVVLSVQGGIGCGE